MSTWVPDRDQWQRWVPDAAAGLAVLVIGLWETHQDQSPTSTWGPVLVVLGLATAVALTRSAPGTALALAWAVGAVHLLTGTGPLVAEVLLAYVAFGCSRWGSTTVVWLSGLSIPLGAAIAVLWLDPNVFYDSLRVAGVEGLARRGYTSANEWRLPAGMLATAILMAPWLLGLALRFSARSQASRRSQVAAEAERDQAAEIARLRDEQTRLAHDVHDVVGHSLAVILAQAESAQFREDDDTAALKQTMANIATSARGSLEDVRQVLATTSGDDRPAEPAGRPRQPPRGRPRQWSRGRVDPRRDAAADAARPRGRRVPGPPGDAHQRDQARTT